MAELKERYTLVVLSNGDMAALGRTVSNLGLNVDYTVSTQAAGAYKPHPAVYRSAV